MPPGFSAGCCIIPFNVRRKVEVEGNVELIPTINIYPADKLIRSARKDCGLTQQALADQADLAVKTIQDVERGRKNTTYETLCQLIERLGISPNSLFPSQMSPEDEAIQRFIGKFRACDPANQEILLSTLDFLAEKLLARQHTSESDSSK